MLLSQLEEVWLNVVWVVLDLEGCRLDLCICEHIKQKRTVVVGDTNALGQALLLDILKSPPCILQARIAGNDLAVGIVRVPARWVSGLRRNILERNGEMDEVEVELVNTPILELLPADWLNLLVFVE